MLKHWKEAVIHLIFWLSTGWLITSGFSVVSHDVEIINDVETVNIVRNNALIVQILVCIIVSMMAFYVNYRLIFRLNRHGTRKRTIWYSALLFSLVLLAIQLVTRARPIGYAPPIPPELASGIFIFYYALSVAFSMTRLLVYNNRRQQEIMVDKQQAELTLLRKQLQPHFLFNALNNLLSLVNSSENPKLMDSFDRLSQLLRYVIEESATDKVSIVREIDFLKNYIRLQALRFREDELDVDFKVEGEADSRQVEPGLFIVFVENAFKYGTEPEKKARIEIAFDLSKQNTTYFRVKNRVLMKNLSGAGTGIDTARRRLNLIYPEAHQLSISESEDFIVELRINTP